MEPHGSENQKNKLQPKSKLKMNRKKLDRFLSSICEKGGMVEPSPASTPPIKNPQGLTCLGPCGRSHWRAHVDIYRGILCVSALPSQRKGAPPHFDVTLCVTFLDSQNKPQRQEMTFCDSEIRWVMETLWHAPIWE